MHFNPWTVCDRFLDAEFASRVVRPEGVCNIGPDGAGRPGGKCTNLAKIFHELEHGLGSGGGEEETKRILRRFSRMYMTTLAMEIDRIESELRHALPEFKCVIASPTCTSHFHSLRCGSLDCRAAPSANSTTRLSQTVGLTRRNALVEKQSHNCLLTFLQSPRQVC